MKWKYLSALSFINTVYLVVGGCIFYIIEHPEAEKEEKSGIRNLIALEKQILREQLSFFYKLQVPFYNC